MNLETLTDTELDAHRIAVLNEQERRTNLAAIPSQVAMLAEQFITAGGAQAELDAAIVPVA